MSNVEVRNPIDFYRFKRQSGAILPFEILRFDIRYSAVRCSVRPATAKVAGLIIKKTVPFWPSFI
jgi:hypothetical protein